MKRIIASLLLLWGAQVIPAAPASSPAAYAQAAKFAADQDNLQEFFTQFRKISDKDPRKAEVLNHFFSKPQVMLGDAYKNQLITVLYDMYKDRFTPGVATIAAQIQVGAWKDYLAEQNPKLADVFEWIRVEKEKRAKAQEIEKTQAEDIEKEQRSAALSKVRALVNTDANIHPYEIVLGAARILGDPKKWSSTIHDSVSNALTVDHSKFSMRLSPHDKAVILSLFRGELPDELSGLQGNQVKMLGVLRKHSSSAPWSMWSVVVEKYGKQLKDTNNAVNAATNSNIPPSLLALIAGYAVEYPWGRSTSRSSPDLCVNSFLTH